ncbi:Protein toc75 [Lathyrus oleraceus]|uniref:Protein toc75 n=1 Tax=Pisum sativum TaxID=3888 RepID=A0A9D5APH4_PEA|nr:Protein toc75 [Pisum sativum]
MVKLTSLSVSGSITTGNFLYPQDDLAFKLEYTHPYWDGLDDPRNRTLHVNCFNSRKTSPTFIAGPGVDELPPVWIDRAGSFTPQSKFTYGLVMEEITTRDENFKIIAEAAKVLPNGSLLLNGPPTSLNGTGIDRMAFLQANITRDNTRFVNEALFGVRSMFQVDQGTKSPFFNRYLLTLTRFFQLMSVEEGDGKSPPPVLVLHGRHGGCFGDLPSYDAFALGGPYSVRGYGMGELGVSRNMLEDVMGNPSEVYRRMGQGSSYGIGAIIGNARAEYAIDHNSGTGAFFFRFGDRF